MAVNKKRFTAEQLMSLAVKLAETDPTYAKAKEVCDLDYEMVSGSAKHKELTKCNFDVVGDLAYGGSEGIYATIMFRGAWDETSMAERRNCWLSVYTLKTLRNDKDAYLALGHMMNVICYYATELISQHLDRFD